MVSSCTVGLSSLRVPFAGRLSRFIKGGAPLFSDTPLIQDKPTWQQPSQMLAGWPNRHVMGWPLAAGQANACIQALADPHAILLAKLGGPHLMAAQAHLAYSRRPCRSIHGFDLGPVLRPEPRLLYQVCSTHVLSTVIVFLLLIVLQGGLHVW